MATPEVKVKIGADTSGFDKGFAGVQARLSTFAKVAGVAVAGAVTAAAAGMVAMTKASMDNIDALSKQARVAGVSVAQFQAMALVAEEAGVSSETLSRSLIKMQGNFVDLGKGTAAQVAAFGALGVTYGDLAKLDPAAQFELLAEKIAAIADPAQRSAAAIDIFGKGGAEALKMLPGYAAALENAAKFQRDLGLAVSDVDAAQIEAANDAMGRTQMAIGGLGTQLAVTFAPAIEAVAVGLTQLVKDVLGVQTALDQTFGSEGVARSILGTEIYDALQRDSEAFRQHAGVIGAYKGTLSTLPSAASGAAMALSDLSLQMMMVGRADIAAKLDAIGVTMREASAAFDKGTISAGQFRAKESAAATEAQRLVSEAGKINGIDVSSANGAIAGLAKILEMAAGRAMALRAAMSSIGTTGAGASASASGTMTLGSMGGTSPIPQQRPMDLGLPAIGGGGGGGGMQDMFAQRLATLQEGLQTEAETVAAWHEESLAILNDQRAQEILGEQGHKDALLRLEEEYQKRLAGIKEAGNKFSLESAMSGASEVFGALGAINKKFLKAQAITAAGAAFISTMQGAAKELENGTFGFASAAAVIAKGLGFIAAIKNAGSSGSTSGAVGGGSSGAATASGQDRQGPMQVSLNTLGGGSLTSMLDVRQLLTSLNEAAGDRGYTILVPQ